MVTIFNDPCEIITVDELCELLYIGKNAAYKILNSGELKAFRIGRTWKISKANLVEYINRKSGFVARY